MKADKKNEADPSIRHPPWWYPVFPTGWIATLSPFLLAILAASVFFALTRWRIPVGAGSPHPPLAWSFVLKNENDGWRAISLDGLYDPRQGPQGQSTVGLVFDGEVSPLDRGLLYPMWTVRAPAIHLLHSSELPFETEDGVLEVLRPIIRAYLMQTGDANASPLDRLDYEVLMVETGEVVMAFRRHDRRVLWPGVGGNLALIASAILFPWSVCWFVVAVRGLRRSVRRRLRFRAGLCPVCTYDTRHLPERRCPECGETWTAEDEAKANPR